MPTGATRVAAVVGMPIQHSLSPAIFNAAFAATGLDWVFVAFETADAPGVIAAARTLGLAGMSVTMPLKSSLAALVDQPSDVARRLGAVNSVLVTEGATLGDNFDGPGLLDALGTSGVSVAGLRCVVLGAGGAARAVVLALAEAGAASITVVNRTAEAAVRCAALAGAIVGDPGAVADGDVVINATSIGMAGSGGIPLDPTLIRPDQIIVDLVYHPTQTPLLLAASERGATAIGGLGMLVHQAARQFHWWTGIEAPVAAMRAAAEAALTSR